MIVRLQKGFESPLIKDRTEADDVGEFARIDLLKLTSGELREQFGITLSPTDFFTTFELVPALKRLSGAAVRCDRVAHVLARRPELLPCFAAYQQAPGGAVLPLMTDAHTSSWSLFFEKSGRMTLVEFQEGLWQITPESMLLPEAAAEAERQSEGRGFLLNGLRAAKKILVRSGGDKVG